jgi:ABC-type dipeptide/oligopeptide/nickel transport system ATPase component
LQAAPGCRFAPRCGDTRPVCGDRPPHLTTDRLGRRVDCLLYDVPEGVSA